MKEKEKEKERDVDAVNLKRVAAADVSDGREERRREIMVMLIILCVMI